MKRSATVRKISLILLMLSLAATVLAILCAKLGFEAMDFEELHEKCALLFLVMVIYHLTYFRKSLKAHFFQTKKVDRVKDVI